MSHLHGSAWSASVDATSCDESPGHGFANSPEDSPEIRRSTLRSQAQRHLRRQSHARKKPSVPACEDHQDHQPSLFGGDER